MKAFLPTLFIILGSSLPLVASALVCSNNDPVVIYINGILTDETTARNDKDALEKKFTSLTKRGDIKFINGYNESHLGGADDLWGVKSYMDIGEDHKSISDYDLVNILKQIHSQVSTQKILLVGHSQGTFYTNFIYDYLTTHGIPASAISVYNIATPASFVAVHGKYLTSGNDKVINWARDIATQGVVRLQPLPANINISLSPQDVADEYGGHNFSQVYLGNASPKIVGDMNSLLQTLRAGTVDQNQDGCFTPPSDTTGQVAKAVFFAAADPVAMVSRPAVLAVGAVTAPIAMVGYHAVATAADKLGDILHALSSKQMATAAFPIASSLYGSSLSEADIMELNDIPVPPPTPTPTQPAKTPDPAPAPAKNTAPPKSERTAAPTIAENPPAPPVVLSAFGVAAPVSPVGFTAGEGGWGGGGGGGGAAPAAQTSTPAPTPTVSIAVTSPSSNIASSTAVTFSGTTDGTNVTVTYGTTTATTSVSGGTWSISITLPEGNTDVAFQADDGNGHAASVSRTMTIDTTPPDAPTITVADCNTLLVSSACLISTTTASVSWGASGGASYYGVRKDGTEAATTTSTSASVSLTSSATSTISVVAYDAAGNSAVSSGSSVGVYENPLIINEVGWAGTDASSTDQWIELKNRTGYTIDLSHVALASQDGTLSVQLSGTLAANSLYLIESRAESTSATHNQTATLNLPTSGAQLLLQFGGSSATTTLDQTPPTSSCGGWCFGSSTAIISKSIGLSTTNTGILSMERKATYADGSLSSSWQNNDAYSSGGTDASSNKIYGTPGAESSNGYPSAGWFCSPDTSSITSGQTYHRATTTVSCTYLSRFVMGDWFGATRYGDVYKGTVGSAVIEDGHSLGKSISNAQTDVLPDAVAGDQMFIAIYEVRSFGDDVTPFRNYFETGAGSPPHSNYIVIPWTWQP